MIKKSPLNYVGGKAKIMKELLEIFPKETNRFIDLFCGGLNVSLNVNYQNILANDICYQLIDFYKFIDDDFVDKVKQTVTNYSLSKTNRQGYLQLRSDYNKDKDPVKFFALITNSFNYQIRFNN